MRSFRALAIAAVATIAALPAHTQSVLPSMLRVLGVVSTPARPASNALVIALNVEDFSAVQAYTAVDGSFTLPQLRAGVYKVIAVKQGFVPAVTTIVPTRADHRVNLRLVDEKHAKKNTAQEIWEIRGSLPPDILRELDAVMAEPAAAEPLEMPKLRGEMFSLAGVGETARPAYAQTSLGVQSRLGEKWQLGFHGNLQRIDAPQLAGTTSPVAGSSVMSMELRSSETDSYRLASTKSWWRYRDAAGWDGDNQADIRAHDFEWEHGESHVQIRYFAQANLYHPSAFDSDRIEIAGDTPVLQLGRGELGVSLRVSQESLRAGSSSATDPLRTADITANGTVSVVPSLTVHYGLASRMGLDQSEFAPKTGAEWKLTKSTSLVASGMYKVREDAGAASLLPSIVLADDKRLLPKYSYSLGFVTGPDDNNRVSAVGTITAVDAPMRVLFTDGFDQFWDGLYVDAGDVRRDLRVSMRRDLGRLLSVEIVTAGGSATSPLHDARKDYVSADLQSRFRPTGTVIAVAYREIHQPDPASAAEYRSERLNVRVAQSLYLPIDLQLLLGVELARSANSPFLVDVLTADGKSRKYLGGVAVNF